MRNTITPQKKLGQTDIAKIEIDLKCRDEILKVLLELQYIYCNTELKEKVFAILKELIQGNINPENGRPGMDLWKILILGCVKLSCNWDYDKLHNIANNHKMIRDMKGHGLIVEKKLYNRQTIVDNVSLFTPEILVNLLFDPIRKVITLISRVCSAAGQRGWRNSRSNIRKIRRSFRNSQNLKRSTSKDDTRIGCWRIRRIL